MAKRRTKQEKIQAQYRHQTFSVNNLQPVKAVNLPTGNPKENPIQRNNFYVPEMSIPLKIVRGDLTKTMLVTILALILEGMLAFYLYQKGGWQQLHAWLPL